MERKGAVEVLSQVVHQMRPAPACPRFWKRVICATACVVCIDTVVLGVLVTAQAKDLRSIADALAGVRSISVSDGTDVLLKATSRAGRITELITLVLKDRGYIVCTGCTADAQAAVTVYKYETRGESKRDFVSGAKIPREVSESKWTLTIMRDNEVVYTRTMHHDKQTALETLAARQVSDMMKDLPRAPSP